VTIVIVYALCVRISIINIYIYIYIYKPSDAGLYNRVTVFHEIHVLDKASKDKVASGSTSGVNFCFNYQPKRQ